MIKKLVNYFTLRPSNPFLDLFVEAAENVVHSADILVQLTNHDHVDDIVLLSQLKYNNQSGFNYLKIT